MLKREISLACVLFPASLIVVSVGCGRGRDFHEGDFLERQRRYLSAAAAFERFAASYPDDPSAPEALVRAGRIYAQVFHHCPEARPLLERAARQYRGHEPWAGIARQSLLDCPDYFPLKDGTHLVYVDSQTGGRNMRLDVRVQSSTDGARGKIEGAYYAGSTRFQDYRKSYAKEDWIIWEIEGRSRVPLLKYPFAPGMHWTAKRDGHPAEFRIESNGETVRLRDATYHDCLKVREAAPGAKAWQYVYYAPGAGPVKMTVGVPGSEHSNTELHVLE